MGYLGCGRFHMSETSKTRKADFLLVIENKKTTQIMKKKLFCKKWKRDLFQMSADFYTFD